jgi:hypothetical protein
MTPVEFSPANKMIIDAFEALPADEQSPDYWEDAAVTPLRGQAKDHYIAEQDYMCAYCRKEIATANKAVWDAEHVVCRQKVAGYMFVPQNLAVSCKDCNIAKGQAEVRTTTRKKFPDQSKHYLIVHPHFDNYEEHIRWVGDICVPVSAKGTRTLVMCDLTRYTAKLLGVKGKLVDPSFDKHLGDLLKAKTKLEAQASLAAISVYVEAIPQD